MSDNIRSYFQHRLNELLLSTGELDIGNHPKLVDRLVTSLPKATKGHIIVVCSTLDDMQNFLRPLHQMRRSEPDTVVVFITEKFPTTREWIEAAAFPGVWVMMGDNAAGLHRSLQNARVTQSRSVLFCADLAKLAVGNQFADGAVMQGTLQAHALTLHNEEVSLVCELTQGGFTRRLAETLHRASKSDRGDDDVGGSTARGGAAASSQQEAAKRLRTKSMKKNKNGGSQNGMSGASNADEIEGPMIDMRSPTQTRSVPKLKKSESMLKREEQVLLGEERALECQMEAANLMQGFLHLETAFVAGLTVPTSLLDLLVCQQYFNPHMMSLVQQFILGRDGTATEDGTLGESVMEYRKVPPSYVGISFGDAFERMLDEDGTLIIGLYRVWSKDQAEVQNYVYTNPRLRTNLRASDGLYCIPPSATMPPESSATMPS
uniref:Calcium-activated potassium channel BK alpha subunit domain-containing protein n=1 Tax=Hemiselmis tepida TaxID=464990 RepID=A0A7S0YPV3_9CRYP